MEEKIYPAKLMLFGEYAVTIGGEALAIPYPYYSAKWVQQSEKESAYKKHLLGFCTYLEQNTFSETLNVSAFIKDLHNGLDMHSTIPIGYGVGSSGAVVAAVYDRYAYEKTDETNLFALKELFASMENYFHKKSSGLDPLVCYLQKPVHVTSPDTLETVNDFSLLSTEFTIQLWDTEQSRSTYKLVQTFKEKLQDDGFRRVIENEYLALNAKCIKQLLPLNLKNFIYTLTQLSVFQLEHFQFAITNDVQRIWRYELECGKRIFKLCGAGGGGFYLYFDLEKL